MLDPLKPFRAQAMNPEDLRLATEFHRSLRELTMEWKWWYSYAWWPPCWQGLWLEPTRGHSSRRWTVVLGRAESSISYLRWRRVFPLEAKASLNPDQAGLYDVVMDTYYNIRIGNSTPQLLINVDGERWHWQAVCYKYDLEPFAADCGRNGYSLLQLRRQPLASNQAWL